MMMVGMVDSVVGRSIDRLTPSIRHTRTHAPLLLLRRRHPAAAARRAAPDRRRTAGGNPTAPFAAVGPPSPRSCACVEFGVGMGSVRARSSIDLGRRRMQPLGACGHPELARHWRRHAGAWRLRGWTGVPACQCSRSIDPSIGRSRIHMRSAASSPGRRARRLRRRQEGCSRRRSIQHSAPSRPLIHLSTHPPQSTPTQQPPPGAPLHGRSRQRRRCSRYRCAPFLPARPPLRPAPPPRRLCHRRGYVYTWR